MAVNCSFRMEDVFNTNTISVYSITIKSEKNRCRSYDNENNSESVQNSGVDNSDALVHTTFWA